MLQLPTGQLLLLLIQTGLIIGLTARLWLTGLHRVYPYFFAYMAAELLCTAIIVPIPFRSSIYPLFWMATEAIALCFYVLIVGELYRLVLRDLPGIASISSLYIKVTVAIAILVSLSLVFLEETPANYVATFFLIERAVAFSLVIFILLVSVFLAYYPIPLNRNVVVYSIGYAVYFLTKATALFVRTLGHYVAAQISVVLMFVSTICLLFWLWGLNRGGELRTMVIGHTWKPEDEQRLLLKLREINMNLVAAARKQ